MLISITKKTREVNTKFTEEQGCKLLENKTLLIQNHFEEESYQLIIRGCFYGYESEQVLIKTIVNLLDEKFYTSATLFKQLKGEFSIVVINKKSYEILIISDVSGTGKLYYAQEDNNLFISNKLSLITSQLKKPVFSKIGIGALQSFSYNLDPFTIVEDVFCSCVGETIVFTQNDEVVKICNREKLFPEQEITPLKNAILQTDDVLTNYFESRYQPNSQNIIYLSGGIDSLIMTHYAKKVFGNNMHTLNFSLSGKSNNEKAEAEIAAKYYKTNHIEYVVNEADISKLTLETFEKTNFPQMGNFMNLSTKNYLSSKFSDSFINIFTGEDTRIYSPTIDLPFKLGFYLTQKHVNPKNAENIYKIIINNWPIRYGKNYSKFFFSKATPCNSIQEYILKNMLRFNIAEQDEDLIRQIMQITANLGNTKNLQQAHYNAIDTSFLLQYSDDNNDSVVSSKFDNLKVHVPFYNAEVLSVAKNIPFKYISKSKLVPPHLTRSGFWFTDKYFLRMLMKGKAPQELLYRKKATAGNPTMIIDYCWNEIYEPMLKYAKELCQSNAFSIKSNLIINNHVNQALSNKEYAKKDFATAWQIHLISWLAFFHKNYMTR